MEIFGNLANVYSNTSITTTTIITVLLMAGVLSIYQFFIYKLISKRSFYNKSFNITIAILPFFIAAIILCLQSNLIITLGTIGALAIIRFRTSIKDPIDMMYLLWSVFIGIICGCRLYEVGVLTSIIVTIVLVSLEYLNFSKKAVILIARSNENIEQELVNIFKVRKISYKFKSRNFSKKGFDYAIELVYKDLEELNNTLSKNESLEKYSLIEYDANDIV